MKITNIKLATLSVPLKTPFKTAVRSVDAVNDLVVMVETDTGNIGYGSAPPTALITGDTQQSLISVINELIKPRLLNQQVEDLNFLSQSIDRAVVNNSGAKAAMDIALYDLFAQRFQTPLYQILGGGEPTLSTDLTISVDYIDKMVEDSLRAIDLGFETLKIKVGKDIGLDIERVKAIYSAVEGRALLRLDANQGWNAKQAVHALRTLESSGVSLELVEQPVKAGDIEGMKFITDRVLTPVMADESAFSPQDVLELLRRRAADIINIKLMKTGGITNALRIADLAAIHDMECMMGCMLESSIGVAAAAHIAVARSNVVTKVDLDVPTLCKFDPVTSGVTFNNAEISISSAPGLGISHIEGLKPLDY